MKKKYSYPKIGIYKVVQTCILAGTTQYAGAKESDRSRYNDAPDGDFSDRDEDE